MYVILILRGSSIAVSARHSFHGLLAMGATSMLGIQTFVIIGGVLTLPIGIYLFGQARHNTSAQVTRTQA